MYSTCTDCMCLTQARPAMSCIPLVIYGTLVMIGDVEGVVWWVWFGVWLFQEVLVAISTCVTEGRERLHTYHNKSSNS